MFDIERDAQTILLINPAPQAASYRFANPVEVFTAHTADDLQTLFQRFDSVRQQKLYAVGYIAFEAGYALEKSLQHLLPSTGQPLACFAFYKDRETFSYLPQNTSARVPTPALAIAKADYEQKIAQIKKHIEQGDTYQLNFTTQLQWEHTATTSELLHHVLAIQPTEFGAFLNLGETRIISASPELFFRRNGSSLVVKPMKGTAPRGLSFADDLRQAIWLENDEKNRAENLMIVDLLRNDLGRICTIGSVKVDKLFEVEAYPTLYQMTSTISGQLKFGTTYEQIFRALFPSGSIVGAPKINTMRLIHELEEAPRGVYTGCIGFIAPEDEAVFSVAIRTITLKNDHATMGVGAGITYDSTAAKEYAETLLKGDFLQRDASPFQLIETMLWDGTAIVLLEEHLARLALSAKYFNFPCNREEIERQLHTLTPSLQGANRLRLLLDHNGEISVTTTAVVLETRPIRVLMSTHRTLASDVFLHHKTTRRKIYNEEFARAQQLGYDEVLFLNTDGFITEGAISNFFIERDGDMLTPPLANGVLSGVLRTYLKPREMRVSLADLKSTDVLYLGNSVRGLQRIESIDYAAAT